MRHLLAPRTVFVETARTLPSQAEESHLGGEGNNKTARERLQAIKVAPCYAYSHSKGLFVGVSLEGAVIRPRKDVNARFYGTDVTPREILSGMTSPPASAEALYEVLGVGLSEVGPMEAEGAVELGVGVRAWMGGEAMEA